MQYWSFFDAVKTGKVSLRLLAYMARVRAPSGIETGKKTVAKKSKTKCHVFELISYKVTKDS